LRHVAPYFVLIHAARIIHPSNSQYLISGGRDRYIRPTRFTEPVTKAVDGSPEIAPATHISIHDIL